jgi:Mg2+-importing ATPase
LNENKDLSLKEDSSNFFSNLRSSAEGLEEKEVQKRKLEELKFALKGEDRLCIFKIFFNQFKSPLILLLLACALLAFFLSDPMDASIIFIIIFISSTLGMIQEKIAFDAMDRLMKLVEVKSKVIREGIKKEISSKEVVTGDLLLLEAGDVLPADAIIIESEHFFVNQAALTGESLPAEKISFNKELDLSSKKRENCVLMGSYVISGAAKAIVFAVGSNSELGKISKRLKAPKLETNFEKGMRKFQGLLVETTFALVFLIFAVNVFLKRGVIDSFLFSLALGIGLTPQLLPMIISVTLAKGARDLAKKKVIIKKSSSLENFGSMSVLCCDKTGTLTSGEMSLHSFYDLDRRLSPHALEYAAVTSFLHAGYDNPLDQAIKKKIGALKGSWEKLDEIPFDFERRRVTLLAKKQSKSQLIVKGSFSEVVKRCSFAQNCDGVKTSIDSCIDQLELLLEEFSEKNSKILAVAYKDLGNQTSFSDEDEMVLHAMARLNIPVILLINKCDQIENRERLLPHIQKIAAKRNFAEVRPIAVLTGHNLDTVQNCVAKYLPQGPFMFPEDQITDRSSKFLAAELIREKITRQLGDELPYDVNVEIEKFVVDGQVIHIHGLILVDKPGQKQIIIGHEGDRLKSIGKAARLDMEVAFDSKVMLHLWVKVKTGWADDERALQSLS